MEELRQIKKILLLEPRSDLSGSVIQCFEYLKRLKNNLICGLSLL